MAEKSGGIAVMLNPAWPGAFSRAVRDEAGQVVERVTFQKAEPLLLTDDQFSAVFDDIGKSLVYCKVADSGEAIGKPDWEATKAHTEPAKKK